MIPPNVLNIDKKEKLKGTTFHLFYQDLHTSTFFDSDFSSPIVWGNKTVVMGWIKKLDELMNVEKETKVRIYSYIITTDGFRRTDTYNGPISMIGKYIKHI